VQEGHFQKSIYSGHFSELSNILINQALLRMQPSMGENKLLEKNYADLVFATS